MMCSFFILCLRFLCLLSTEHFLMPAHSLASPHGPHFPFDSTNLSPCHLLIDNSLPSTNVSTVRSSGDTFSTAFQQGLRQAVCFNRALRGSAISVSLCSIQSFSSLVNAEIVNSGRLFALRRILIRYWLQCAKANPNEPRLRRRQAAYRLSKKLLGCISTASPDEKNLLAIRNMRGLWRPTISSKRFIPLARAIDQLRSEACSNGFSSGALTAKSRDGDSNDESPSLLTEVKICAPCVRLCCLNSLRDSSSWASAMASIQKPLLTNLNPLPSVRS